MPLWERDIHEGYMEELQKEDLTEARRFEILTEMRNHHTQALQEENESKEKLEKLDAKNRDLKDANSELWLTYGRQQQKPEEDPQEVKKEFSETVTIEQLSQD